MRNKSGSTVGIVERMVIGKRDESMQKEWANKDRYRPSSGVPERHVASLPRGEGSVRNIARGPRVFPARGVTAHLNRTNRQDSTFSFIPKSDVLLDHHWGEAGEPSTITSQVP